MSQVPELHGSARLGPAIIYFLYACLPTAYLVANTGKTSHLRSTWLPYFAFLAHRQLQNATHATSSTVINGLIAGESMVVLLQCVNLLLVTRLEGSDLQRAGVVEGGSSTTRTIQAFGLLLNLRGINTPWQVKNFHQFPKALYTAASPSSNGSGIKGKPNPNNGPTESRIGKQRFIIRQAVIISWQYLFMDIIQTSELDADPAMNDKLFGASSEFTYLSATPEQWAGRVSIGIAAWFGPARVNIDMWYRILSLVFVTLGLSKPEDWPPLFGSMFEAYTLRGFWSGLWHQFCRWPLTSFSNYIARDLLKLPRPSLLERYLNIFLVFAGSGAAHAIVDAYAHVPLIEMRAMAFFTSFALGIMIEDGVQYLWRRYVASSPASESSSVPLWHKVVGFAWVGTWMMMTAPWFIYPQARLPAEIKWQIPISVVQRVGPPVAQAVFVGGGLAIKFLAGGEL